MEFSTRVDEILKEWDVDYLNLLNNSDEYKYIDIGFKNINYFSYIPKDKIRCLKDISESNLIYSSELRTQSLSTAVCQNKALLQSLFLFQNNLQSQSECNYR